MKSAIFIISALLFQVFTLNAQCDNCYFFINEVTNCNDGQLKLQAVTNGIFEGWTTTGDETTIESPASEITVVKPKITTTYKATGKATTSNLITNGTFDNGVNGFYASYSLKNANGLFDAGSDVTFEVDATDSDGSVVSVDFYNGSTFLGSDNTAPFTYTLSNALAGEYFIRAVATDNDGLITDSEVFPLVVGGSIPNSNPATLTKRGSGSSTQEITSGNAIDDFYYEWTTATTVEVYGIPTGITVNIDNTNKEVSFSGTPTVEGIFDFTVYTVGGAPNAIKSGTITVTGTGAQYPNVSITWPYDGLEFDAGDYAVVTDPSTVSSSFVSLQDHTGNGGNMLIADGSKDISRSFYSIDLTVTLGESYFVDLWATNIHQAFQAPNGTLNSPVIGIFINGTLVAFQALSPTIAWQKISHEWLSNTTGTITFELRNLNDAVEENDLAIDDIGFYTLESIEETITLSPCPGKNIFSPDGDGRFETFFIEGTGTAKIYQPGGRLIKTLTLPAYWDGTDKNGQLVNAGYYAIIINDSTYSNVTIVR